MSAAEMREQRHQNEVGVYLSQQGQRFGHLSKNQAQRKAREWAKMQAQGNEHEETYYEDFMRGWRNNKWRRAQAQGMMYDEVADQFIPAVDAGGNH